MKLSFLGSGGGRFSAISQRRMTGGFRIDNLNGKNYHVDPGPGALIRSYQFGFDPRNLDGVFISHAHTDHYNDAEILIEAMTRGMTKHYGTIFGSQSVMEGYKQWGPCISQYHQSSSEKVILKPDSETKVNGITVRGTTVQHGDPHGCGFQIEDRGFKLSYTSDTGYFDGLAQAHEGADILIASVLRPGNKTIPGHMCSRNFVDLINEVKPKVAVMTHLGLKMISSNPVKEAKKIGRQTGVKTIAAYDGLSFNVNYNNPRKFRLISLKDVESHSHSSTHDMFVSERKNTYQQAFNHREFDEVAFMRKK